MYAVSPPKFELVIAAYNTDDIVVSLQGEVIAVASHDGYNWESPKCAGVAEHIEALIGLLKQSKQCRS